MSTLINEPMYEDDKTYPVIMLGGIREVTGRAIKNRLNSREITLTVGQYQDLLDRIARLESLQS